MPEAVVECAQEYAIVKDTAVMTLDDTHADIKEAHRLGKDVARVHSGDPSLYGAIAEQIRRLKTIISPIKLFLVCRLMLLWLQKWAKS